MAFTQSFEPLEIDGIAQLAEARKRDGWRFVQILCINTEDGIDMLYSFEKDGALVNSKVKGVTPDDAIPSITDRFLEAFVFENESHDLFGVNIENIAIDFAGRFYDLAESTPMTIVSPAQKAAREKAAKVAAAKAAKAAKAAEEQKAARASEGPSDAPDAQTGQEEKPEGAEPEEAAEARDAADAKAADAAAAGEGE